MTFDWQIMIVAACVIWAVSVLARRTFRLFADPVSPGCGTKGCHDCPSKAVETSGLVQLQLPGKP